jgi:hypothetical protein
MGRALGLSLMSTLVVVGEADGCPAGAAIGGRGLGLSKVSTLVGKGRERSTLQAAGLGLGWPGTGMGGLRRRTAPAWLETPGTGVWSALALEGWLIARSGVTETSLFSSFMGPQGHFRGLNWGFFRIRTE